METRHIAVCQTQGALQVMSSTLRSIFIGSVDSTIIQRELEDDIPAKCIQ